MARALYRLASDELPNCPRTGIHSSRRYKELVQRARALEQEHGFRLCPDDYDTMTDLRCAMRLFKPLPACAALHFPENDSALNGSEPG